MIQITVGYEGATDSCLQLKDHRTGYTREFLVEGLGWRLLSDIAFTSLGRLPISVYEGDNPVLYSILCFLLRNSSEFDSRDPLPPPPASVV